MLTAGRLRFCSEAYEVVRSIEVQVDIAGDSRRIRIDVLHDLLSGKYTTQDYVQETLPVVPVGSEDKNYNYIDTWVPFDLPWTDGNTPDEALASALSFLEERVSAT